MIPVKPVPEPADFEVRVRRPGNEWLEKNAGTKKSPRNYWSPFSGVLADACECRCAYTAMYTSESTVDHFRSIKTHPQLAYEWPNYRHAGSRINSRKKHNEVLDPHDVGEGWFEILIPSMLLVKTDSVPADYQRIVGQTIKILRLSNDPVLIKLRRRWYDLYKQDGLPFEVLRKVAPLIAAAVEKEAASKSSV
jgi:hypothetical protein